MYIFIYSKQLSFSILFLFSYANFINLRPDGRHLFRSPPQTHGVGNIFESEKNLHSFKMAFDGYGYEYEYHETSFEHMYRCYPPSFIDKPQLENGDKIFLHIDYPMLFELRNDSSERVSHCGVLEFTSEEGIICMPCWVWMMMENMKLKEGDLVCLKNVSLRRAKYIKLQPHSTDFLDISNPKAILETTLRNFTCLSTGDTIMVAYNNKKYYINIIETKPSHAVSIIETDCEVDFAPPLDYKEPERPIEHVPSSKPSTQDEEVPTKEEPKFSPFTGLARRLNGKPSTSEIATTSSSESKDKQSDVVGHGKSKQPSVGSSSPSLARKSQGKLVFGSNSNRMPTQKETPKESKKEEAEKKVEPKFQPFTGKKYSLRG
ncbi:hypothetical protein G4B88_006991 [Cannabis sativa]|uniref:Uncharacterized protein n=1 Tax=Cannabis sativa TaxID=3483 RepID=A0A7J6FNP1_CANSA|nr:hypothetical protein G4B88_006991 [Cannabis sativa]